MQTLNKFLRITVATLTLSFLPVLAFAQSKAVSGGGTSVQLSPTFVAALSSLGVAPSILGKSSLINGVASFPVTGGVFDVNTGKTEVAHTGGLKLTAGAIAVDLRDFTIQVTGGQPILTGAVLANGTFVGRVPLFNLAAPTNLSLPVPVSDEGYIQLEGIAVTLTDAAAGALNGVFGTTALQAGFPIGTARLQLLTADFNIAY